MEASFEGLKGQHKKSGVIDWEVKRRGEMNVGGDEQGVACGTENRCAP